jgi:predicted short-subunit dehydrogenase-like oxidoreductase (DUF2520 family)
MTGKKALGPPSPFRVFLIGAGRVGSAIADLLRRRGHTIAGVTSRTAASAQRSASLLKTRTFRLDTGDVPEVDVLLIGASEHALPTVVDTLSPFVQPGSVIWHVAGSMGIEPLTPLLERGGLGCALHPMQACPTVEAAIANLPGSSWGVTVSPGLQNWAHRLVSHDLDGVPINVPEEHRALWHAASIITSTGITAVMSVGEALLRQIGVATPHEVLKPLIGGTISHALSKGGGHQAVTGPVVRGERSTLIRHLDALADVTDRSLVHDYLTVTRLVLERAVAAERIDESLAATMRGLLRDAPGQ